MVFDININPLSLTLIVTLLTWFIIALGASTVFLTKKISSKFLDISLGFAAGILISVSLFSLILPAIEISNAEINSSMVYCFNGISFRRIFNVDNT